MTDNIDKTSLTERSASSLDRSLADRRLPEAVDHSEGGWATDFAASIMGFLFFISAVLYYNETDYEHFKYLHLGTWMAHFFGGLAHRFYPNRASDGVGQRGFYVMMILGYAGNCLRYGMGWGLEPQIFGTIAALNVVWSLVAGIHVMYKMEHTSERVDDAEGINFAPNLLFGLGEGVASLMEVVTSVYYLYLHGWDGDETTSLLFTAAVAANLIGWTAVYLWAIFYLACGIDYDPSLMQRVFHYSMLVMLWSIDTAVRSTQ
jgi:hypothetical protein